MWSETGVAIPTPPDAIPGLVREPWIAGRTRHDNPKDTAMHDFLKIEKLSKAYVAAKPVFADVSFTLDARRIRLHHRPLGLRQDHHPQRAGRAGHGDLRQCVHGRPRSLRPEPGAWRGVPEPCADALADGAQEHRLRRQVALARVVSDRDQRPCGKVCRHGGSERRHRQETLAALRRHEAARGHCPGVCDPAQDAAARRALRRARCADARHHPGRTHGHRARDPPDRLHDHARRGRGHPAGRPHPADEQRQRNRPRATSPAASPKW